MPGQSDKKSLLRVVRIHSNLIFGGVADQTFGVAEGNIRGCSTVTLIIGDNLNAIILPYTDTSEQNPSEIAPQGNLYDSRVGGAKIDTDSFCRGHDCGSTAALELVLHVDGEVCRTVKWV
jgi:hypothetical protein